MAVDASELVFLVVGVLVASAQPIVLQSTLRRFFGRSDPLRTALESIPTATRMLRRWVLSQGPLDGLSADVRSLVVEWHVRFAQYLFCLSVVPCWLVLVQALIRVMLGTSPDEFTAARVCGVVGVLMLVLANRFSHALTDKLLDRWCAVWMLWLMALPWTCPAEALLILSPAFAVIRIMACTASLDTRLILLGGVLCGSSNSLKFAVSSHENLVNFIIVEVFVTFCLLIGVALLKEFLILQAHLTVASKADFSAASALLNTMSDAVLELNEKLTIVGPAPQLACLLLHDPMRSLDGQAFQRLSAANRDEAAFVENMTLGEDATATTLANVFHMELRDCCRTPIPVEVFHICFLKSDGRRSMCQRHLLGVREFGDDSRTRVRPRGSHVADLRECRSRAAADQNASDGDGASESGEGSNSCSSRSNARAPVVLPRKIGSVQPPPGEVSALIEPITVAFDTTSGSIVDLQKGFPPRPYSLQHDLKMWDILTTQKELSQNVRLVCLDLFSRHNSLKSITIQYGDEVDLTRTGLGEQYRYQARVTEILSRAPAGHSSEVFGSSTLRRDESCQPGAHVNPSRGVSIDGSDVGSSCMSSGIHHPGMEAMRNLMSL